MRPFKLNVRKAIQAIGVLLRATDRERLEYLSIIKLLYLADRENLKEVGSPITGDVTVAMSNGPVLSGIYDLVRHDTEKDLDVWITFLHKDEYDLVVVRDPGVGLLSPCEVRKLEEVARRCARCDWRELIRITHELPEWQANDPAKSGMKMLPISLKDILKAVGREEDFEWIAQDAAAAAAMQEALGA